MKDFLAFLRTDAGVTLGFFGCVTIIVCVGLICNALIEAFS